MCGIGGILRTDGQPIPEEWLDAIDARIAYRGPDGAGRFRDRVTFTDEQGRQRVVEVAFVHRRLSIIDHKDGHQPMVSERGRNESEGLVAVVFNGCIYNHRELRKELEAQGHRFVTDHSDTEVLIHGWREWGYQLPNFLEGMYALAIWDRLKRAVFLARDLYGEKPLYERHVCHRDGPDYSCYAFSSSRAALTGAESELSKTDRAMPFTGQYLLYGHSWGEVVEFFAGQRTSMVKAGDRFLIGGEQSTFGGGLNSLPNVRSSATEERIQTLLEQAIARRLEADVPLGCFLSGGIDSSLIAHFAKRHKPDLKTFTVRMPDARYDESKYAQSVAQHLGTDHHTLDVEMNPAADLVHLIDTLGQPFGDSSILPTYWVSKAARQHVKVALAGDGGDELFIGYERYMAARQIHVHYPWFGWIPGWLHRGAHPKSLRSKVARAADVSRDYQVLGVRALEALFTLDELEELVGGSVQLPLMDGVWSRSFTKRMAWRVARSIGSATDADEPEDEEEDPLEELRRIDILEYLPQDLLTKTDTTSMACALEVRCPFLDRDLATAVLSMPVDKLIPGGERKGLLRRIARKYLPRECVDRPKMGFAIPIGEWFRSDDLPYKGSGMKTLLLDHLNSDEPFGPIQLNRKTVQRFIDEHMSGKRDHGQRLFTLLTLSIWARSAG